MAEIIRSFRKNHLSELQALAQIRQAGLEAWFVQSQRAMHLQDAYKPGRYAMRQPCPCLPAIPPLLACLLPLDLALPAPFHPCSGSSLGYGSAKKAAEDAEESSLDDEEGQSAAGGDGAAVPATA